MSKRPPHDRKRRDIMEAEKLGWKYVKTSGCGKLVFEHPESDRKLNLCNSIGEGRAIQNAIAKIRRYTREAVA